MSQQFLGRRDQLRVEALHAAVSRLDAGDQGVLQSADAYFAWLVRHETAKLAISVQVTRPDGTVAFVGQITQSAGEGNTPLMTAMQDADTATIVLNPEDSMGQPTGDTLSITQDDGGTPTTGGAAATPGSVANVTYATDANGKATDVTLSPVAEGTVTITVSDPSAPDVAPFVNTFNVAPGQTASIVGTVTVNTGANTPPAPPAT
jgi:hypothetical protein